MSGRYLLWLSAIIAASAAALALFSAAATAENDPDPAGGSVLGDWTVTGSLSFSSVTIYIESGNLTVTANGTLDLSGVTLRFNPSSDGGQGLEVQAGGTLVLDRWTSISSNRSDVHYRFVVLGSMTMNATTVSEVWGDSASWEGGIQVFSDSVSITNSTVQNGRTGGISIFNCSPTISTTTVQYNGQDGQSPEHAFGIYGTGTDADITSCTIRDNRFFRLDHTALVLTKSPTSGSVYWNGNYYSGTGTTASPYYRYEYYYYTNRTTVNGVGLFFEGGSTASLAGNTVSCNGWAAPGSYTAYTALPVIKEDATHTVRNAMYQYLNNNLHGVGISCRDSDLDIVGNVIDRNGCEPTTSSYVSYGNQAWLPGYRGEGIRMVDSGGTVSSNSISNSASLINLSGSDPAISENSLASDFLTYSYLPDRTARGIVIVTSAPSVRNNTISLRVQDTMVTVDNVQYYMMEAMVGIEIVDSPGLTIEGNKVTTETYSAYNFVACACINASMLSSDLKLLNNTLDHKASGTAARANVIPSTIVQLSVLSHAYLEGNLLRATIAVPAGGNVGVSAAATTRVVGLAVSYGTAVRVSGGAISGPHYGVLVSDFSKVELSGTNISSCLNAGLRVEAGCGAETDSCDITSTGTARGVEAVGAAVVMRNSRLRDPLEFLLDQGASVDLYNTTHDTESFTALDNGSWLNVSWPVALRVVWQDGRAAENARFVLRTVDGRTVLSTLTGPDGSPSPLLWVPEYMVHDASVSRFWPHVVEVSRGRATAREVFMFKSLTEATVYLVDSVPPALVVNRPAPGALLNESTVRFRGEASDPETGLGGSMVEIKVDGLDWTSVSVEDGFWDYDPMLSDGFHACAIRATDGMGNTIRTYLSFTVDTTAPFLQVLSPSDGSHSSRRTVTVSGVSEPGAVVSLNGKLASCDGRHFTTQISLDEGPNTLTVVAVDDFGNTRTVLLLVRLDTRLPDLRVSSPAPGSFTNQDHITVAGTAEPSVDVLVNGLPAQLSGSSFETVVTLSEGVNVVTVTVTDAAGNVNSIDLTVTLDTVRPDLSVTSPRDGTWTSDRSLEVLGLAESGSTVTVNGLVTPASGGRFSCTLLLNEGANSIEVEVRDPAGNVNPVDLTVYLDTSPPGLTVTSPGDGLVTSSRTVRVAGTVDLCRELTVNGRAVPVTDFAFSTVLVLEGDGAFEVEVEARDLAGNAARTSLTVTVDTVPPAISLLAPADGSRIKARSVVLSGRTEPGSTVWLDAGGSVPADANGTFTITAPLEAGENWLVLRARDGAGNAGARTVRLVRPAAAPAGEGPGALGNAAGIALEAGLALAFVGALALAAWAVLRSPRGDGPAPGTKGREGRGKGSEGEADEDREGPDVPKRSRGKAPPKSATGTEKEVGKR